MSIPTSQDRNVTCDIKRNFKRTLAFCGIVVFNPIAWICIFIDIAILLVGFGFIWQVAAYKPYLRPFILTRCWVDVGYYHHSIAQKKSE